MTPILLLAGAVAWMVRSERRRAREGADAAVGPPPNL